MEKDPKKLAELRQRVLENLPEKERESPWHIAILYSFYEHKIPLMEEELKLLDKHNRIRLDGTWKRLKEDESGDAHLSVVSKFGDSRDFLRAVWEMRWYPERMADLRSILDRISPRHKGTSEHARAIIVLALEKQWVSPEEKEIAMNHGFWPDEDQIRAYQHNKGIDSFQSEKRWSIKTEGSKKKDAIILSPPLPPVKKGSTKNK